MSLTRALAALIVDTLPSADAREKARAGLLDFLAVTLPVTRGDIDDSGLKSLRQVYRANDAQSRALRLGYAGHALDFDDFHADFRGHPSTVILPALLALAAERADIDGDRFLDAYVIGVEAAGRLGLAAGPRHYTLGFHSTATLGTIAAAAACARFVGAGARDTAVILGIAATRPRGYGRSLAARPNRSTPDWQRRPRSVPHCWRCRDFTARQIRYWTHFSPPAAPVRSRRKN